MANARLLLTVLERLIRLLNALQLITSELILMLCMFERGGEDTAPHTGLKYVLQGPALYSVALHFALASANDNNH